LCSTFGINRTRESTTPSHPVRDKPYGLNLSMGGKWMKSSFDSCCFEDPSFKVI
jgi:hypothetical protein